ncbi:MAG: metalloregulator ArsR/SmtB family transcription factor [Steroidobacteraceae bacterium]
MVADTLSATFAALADPTRRAILARLTSGETSVSELAEPFHMTLPAVTKHLKVLENAGLVVRSREAQWRPCALRATPLKEAAHWLDEYRQHWEQRLDRLEAYLHKLQSERGNAKAAARKSTQSAANKNTKPRKRVAASTRITKRRS